MCLCVSPIFASQHAVVSYYYTPLFVNVPACPTNSLVFFAPRVLSKKVEDCSWFFPKIIVLFYSHLDVIEQVCLILQRAEHILRKIPLCNVFYRAMFK
jgi:hypothetical protein